MKPTPFLVLVLAGALASCASQMPAPFPSARIVVTVVTPPDASPDGRQDRSAGADVVLIPGLASHPSVWDAVVERLGDGPRIHVVHVRGFAGLEPGANASGPVVAPVADDLAAYIRAAGLHRPLLVGHSMGGIVAMMIAARHPDVAGPVLSVDAPPFIGVAFGGNSPDATRPAADAMRQAIVATAVGAPGDPLESLAAGMTRQDAARAALIAQARATHRATAAQAFHDLIVTDMRPELSRIAGPLTMLFAVPEEWPMSDEEFVDALGASFANAPHAQLVRVSESGHAIHVDQPAVVVDAIRELTAR